MEASAETVIIDFNSKAVDIYTVLLEQFLHTVSVISRREDENVFRLASARYISVLKERLEDEAKKTLHHYNTESFYSQLNASFPGLIHYYLQEFDKRSRSL